MSEETRVRAGPCAHGSPWATSASGITPAASMPSPLLEKGRRCTTVAPQHSAAGSELGFSPGRFGAEFARLGTLEHRSNVFDGLPIGRQSSAPLVPSTDTPSNIVREPKQQLRCWFLMGVPQLQTCLA